MDNRLFIIEGVPCSGKSTTSKYIADVLQADNKVCYIDEGSGVHPADYEFHAFLQEDDMTAFSDEEQAEIRFRSQCRCGGHIVALAQFSGSMFDRLLQKKIYDLLPWETEMPVMLDKWQQFCDSAEKYTVYVFNCVLLQNPMCETLMRFGFEQQRSLEYITKIAQIIETMKPVVIYLKNDDVTTTVSKAAKEREGWLEGVVDYHVNGAYGKSIGAVGFDGYISCLEERQRRELEILSQLPLKSLVIENAHRDWDKAYQTIDRYMEDLRKAHK